MLSLNDNPESVRITINIENRWESIKDEYADSRRSLVENEEIDLLTGIFKNSIHVVDWLTQNATNGGSGIESIVTVDKKWLDHHTIESKLNSMS